jgi:hypothetical protein
MSRLSLGMAKKAKKKSKLKMSKETSKQIRHLETDLHFTLRAIDGKSEDLDLLFVNQAKRIRSQIDKLKENQ